MISSNENRIIYNGNGAATEFGYQFKILEKTDINVVLVDPDLNETTLTKDYFVDMEKSVVLYPGYSPGAEPPEAEQPPILPEGWQLVLYRDVPITQESHLDEHFPFNVIEAMADKLTIICQQLYDGVNRCFRVGEATPIDVDTTVPWEAGKGFRISDDGKKIEVTEDPAKVLPIAAGLLSQTTQQANIATQKATAAAESALSAADSEVNAETAMTQARASAALSQKWADSAESPDGQEDADSPTGDTMSAKEWALYAKDLIQQIDPDKIVTGVTETDGTVNVETGDGNSNSFEVLTPSMKNAVNGVAGLDNKSKLLSQLYDFASQAETEAGIDDKKPLNAKAVKQAIEYNKNKDTAVLYINGGTAEAPANVAINSRYVEENPFPGYFVYTKPQLYINDNWHTLNFVNVGTGNEGYGISASQLGDTDTIIIQTGERSLGTSRGGLNGADYEDLGSSIQNPTPCRVLVYKLGKIGE